MSRPSSRESHRQVRRANLTKGGRGDAVADSQWAYCVALARSIVNTIVNSILFYSIIRYFEVFNTGLFHPWEGIDSSLSNELMPDGFPIAPRWIRPILTAGLTATECLLASELAKNAPVRLHCWNVVSINARHTLGEVGGSRG